MHDPKNKIHLTN